VCKVRIMRPYSVTPMPSMPLSVRNRSATAGRVRPASSGMLASGSSSGILSAIASKLAIFIDFPPAHSHCHEFSPKSAGGRGPRHGVGASRGERSMASASDTALRPGWLHNRWLQLSVGIICMVTIANLQYSWTMFVHPIDQKYGWGRAAIQVAFTIFVIAETFLVPFEGLLVDRFGPRFAALFGGICVAAAWILNAFADSLLLLYVGAALGGMGAGCVYGTCVGNALKWFPDRRGLAVGLTAAGFGAGAALTVVPIQYIIATSGYEAAFLWFGIGQGIVVCSLSWLLRAPDRNDLNAIPIPAQPRVLHPVADYSPLEAMRTPVFWLMYGMLVLVSAGGLVMMAQLAPIAHDFKVVGVPVSLVGLTLPALTFALSIDRVLNGITRPLCGWVSDHIGRENTMFIAFMLEAVGIVLLSIYGRDPLWFVILGGTVFFAWGEIASLFPSTCTDTYGSKYATTNAALLYTGKGVASLLVPVASLVVAETGNWETIFVAAAAMTGTAAILAIGVLRPMRAAHHARAVRSMSG
jgi:OFA family oxalate/formate antiporter-like MFS transporter